MKIRYFELMFPDGYSMVIKGTRFPSIAEAEQFVASDMKNLRYTEIVDVIEWEESDARSAFDFDNEENWPVFDREKIERR